MPASGTKLLQSVCDDEFKFHKMYHKTQEITAFIILSQWIAVYVPNGGTYDMNKYFTTDILSSLI